MIIQLFLCQHNLSHSFSVSSVEEPQPRLDTLVDIKIAYNKEVSGKQKDTRNRKIWNWQLQKKRAPNQQSSKVFLYAHIHHCFLKDAQCWWPHRLWDSAYNVLFFTHKRYHHTKGFLFWGNGLSTLYWMASHLSTLSLVLENLEKVSHLCFLHLHLTGFWNMHPSIHPFLPILATHAERERERELPRVMGW